MKTILKSIKENYKLVIGVFIVSMLLGWLFFHSSTEATIAAQGIEGHEGHDHESADPTTWTCSMHPQIKQDKPGKCPICAMDLIPLKSMSSGGDDVDPNEIVMSDAAAKLASIQTMIVSKGAASKTLNLQGKIQADERNIAELTARFGGRIEKLFVNFTGQNVKKGDKLATIYSPGLVTAQRELIESISFKKTRPSLYAAAKGKLKLWDLTDEQISAIEEKGEAQLYFDVLSPITGTVAMRHIAVGDYVKEGSALFKVIDLTKVWAMFDAYESDLPWIKLGDKVDFTVQAIPGKTFSAKVSYIDLLINMKTRVAKVRVEVPNPKLSLKPEMFSSGILNSKIAESSNEIMLPKSAILWTGKRAVVYVKVQNRESPSFLYREVVLGPEAGAFYVISEGLQEGEEIAVNGVFKIDAASQLQGLPSMMNPSGGAVSTGHNHGDMTADKSAQGGGHEMFKVYGNCEMCKDRIEEAALSVHGVTSANWEVESKMLHLNYKEGHVEISDVHKAIAKVGHDTELEKAPDGVYSKLPGCCLYDRPQTQAQAQAHDMFMVYGNCEMCKDRIEEAAMSVHGVSSANWEVETKMLHLNYKEGHVEIKDVHKAIAKVGHDTELEKAPDGVYSELPGCCLYDRKK